MPYASPEETIPEELFSETYHRTVPSKGSRPGFVRIRAKMRLPSKPIADLLRSKRKHFESVERLGWHCGITEREAGRILYEEHNEVHIDTVDTICMNLDTTLLEVYGE